jgi:hypothetical protein
MPIRDERSGDQPRSPPQHIKGALRPADGMLQIGGNITGEHQEAGEHQGAERENDGLRSRPDAGEHSGPAFA